MTLLPLCVVAVALLPQLCGAAGGRQPAAAVVSVPRLPMEAHGFNALDTWPQLLAKGVRWMKIDVAVVTRAACAAHSTWGQAGRGNASDCFADGGTEYCCLGLSGDTGSRPALADAFNTTHDLLAFLDDAANAPLLPSAPLPAGGRPLVIGLDAGGSPGGCLAGCAAAKLFTDFLTGWAAVAARRQLAVVGANDVGFSGWFADLDTRCAAPGGCSGTDAVIQALPFVSQAGQGWSVPAGAAAARFQVLNEDYDGFAACCASDCWTAAVAPSAAYPWLWYEQTGQGDFLRMIRAWQGCAALPAARRANISNELVLVSNMAPEAVEVYSAPAAALGRGVNAALAGAAQLSDPWLVSVRAGASGGRGGGDAAPPQGYALLAARAPGGVTQLYQMAAAPGEAPAQMGAATPGVVVAEPLAALAWASVAGEDDGAPPNAPYRLLLSAGRGGAIAAHAYAPAAGAFADFAGCGAGACEWAVPLPAGGELLAAAAACAALPQAVPQAPADLPCALLTLTAAPGSGGAVLALRMLAPAAPVLANATLVRARVDRGASLALVYNSTTAAWDGVAVYSSSANESGWPAPGGPGTRAYLYASSLAVAAAWPPGGGGPPTASIAVAPAPPATGYPPRIGLGASPRLVASRFHGQAAALLVSVDGVCDAALYTNNADMWRCGLQLPTYDSNLFYSAFQTVPGLLQYDFGALGAWRDLAMAAGARHLGICSRNLAHGKFEAAVSASPALMPWTVSRDGAPPRDELALLVAHDAALPEVAPQWLLCGLPDSKVGQNFTGLVWDAFSILSLDDIAAMGGGAL